MLNTVHFRLVSVMIEEEGDANERQHHKHGGCTQFSLTVVMSRFSFLIKKSNHTTCPTNCYRLNGYVNDLSNFKKVAN